MRNSSSEERIQTYCQQRSTPTRAPEEAAIPELYAGLTWARRAASGPGTSGAPPLLSLRGGLPADHRLRLNLHQLARNRLTRHECRAACCNCPGTCGPAHQARCRQRSAAVLATPELTPACPREHSEDTERQQSRALMQAQMCDRHTHVCCKTTLGVTGIKPSGL